MRTDPLYKRVPALHFPDQLIVDLHHLEVVQGLLTALGIRSAELTPDDQDELLGLARLQELTSEDGEVLEVGEVLALLRQQAAAERDGWQPIMGKNRLVDAVIGEGHKPMGGLAGALVGHKPMGGLAGALVGHKPMAGAEPVPVAAAELPAALSVDPAAGRGVRVGLVDTAPLTPGLEEGPVPFRAGHAIFVSSLVRRQAPGAELHVEGVLDAATGRADSWDTARAMLRLATTRQVHILNLSLGAYTIAGGPPLVIARAIQRLAPDVLVIAAAGNHGALPGLTGGRTARSACWPAAVPPTVAVGAVDDSGNRPPWSPAAAWVTCVAPGVDVVGEFLTGAVETSAGVVHFDGHARWSGTSFAAATVSGAVAARTVPGVVSPHQALAALLAEGGVVWRAGAG